MKNQRGFTLIELAITSVILGLAMVTFIAIYKPYVAQQKIYKTEDRLANIYAALESYKADRGFYPCPASLTSARNQANYGFASDCTDTTTVAGACSPDGYCVRSSTRALANPRVRVGAVPFRELNIEEADTYDAYGSRYYFAITENLAISPAQYDDNIGGIDVVDGRGVSLTAGTPASAKFLVFSPGINQVGGYNRNGNEVVSCATAAPYNGADKQNCEPIADAVFAFTGEVGEGLADEMDDFVTFDNAALNQTSVGWRTGDPGNLDFEGNNESENDIITTNSVKIGDFEETPRHALDVSGDLSDMRAEDALVAENGFCNYTDSATGAADGCFAVANLERTCPNGEYVTGLGPDDGFNIICSPIAFRCDADQMIIGVDGDGLPICAPVPAPALQAPTPNGTTSLTLTGVNVITGGGNVIGIIGTGGTVTDGNGNVIGSIGTGGTVTDGNGNVIGSIGTGGTVTDGGGNVIGSIGTGGTVTDGNGNVVGSIGIGGTVTDGNGNVIGSIASGGSGTVADGNTVGGSIGSGGTVTDGNGNVIGEVGVGGTIVDGNGDVIGALDTGGTVTDGNGNVIGEVGFGGTVIDGNGDIIGSIGAGGSVTDGNGNVIGEVGGNVTTTIYEEEENCTEEVRTNTLQCPDNLTLSYNEYEIYSCADNQWIDQGNDKTSACCALGPDPVVTVATANNFGSPWWVCGSYGKGSRITTKYPNFGTCTLGNATHDWSSCECLPPGTGNENPPDYDPNENYIQTCAIREFTYPKDSNSRCTQRVEQGDLLDEGSVTPGSFQWTLNGASPDNVDLIGASTRKEGDSCYEAGARNRCATRSPVSGEKHQYYNGCTCEIIEQQSPVKCE